MLLAHFEQHPSDQNIGVLEAVFKKVNRRTLQRHLATLIEGGKIEKKGYGKSTVYQLLSSPSQSVASRESTYVPMSSSGQEVRDLIRRPILKRQPVAYDRVLLEDYLPNETHYLPSNLRASLHELGHQAHRVSPAGTYAHSIIDRLLIDLSWASSRLEGNTYSRLDTQNLIEFGQAATGRDQAEAQMILNHKAAIEMLIEDAASIGFNRYTFFNLHAILADNLLKDPTEAGVLRSRIVAVTGTVFIPLSVPQQIERLFDLLLSKADEIKDPFEQAFFVMVHIPYLQGFEDVNKRLSRLGANIPLVKRNLTPLSFVDVPQQAYVDGTLGVYELGRIELLRDVFSWAYERSCQRYAAIKETVAEPDPIRLKYRRQLFTLVKETVQCKKRPNKDALRKAARAQDVPDEDCEIFVKMVLDDLARLHEGNVARYRLRLSEFKAWQQVL